MRHVSSETPSPASEESVSDLFIPLGTQAELETLFSYPNVPHNPSGETLSGTIERYFTQTLKRDGFLAQGAGAQVVEQGSQRFLRVHGPRSLMPQLLPYGPRFSQFLQNGREALTTVQRLKEEGRWEPHWRFFLPLGMAMLSQRSLQFFHYPPLALLQYYQNYLVDPVPARWEQLLEANGARKEDVQRYETVIDGAPIAAQDDAGRGIPIEAFTDYQKAQVQLLLNPVGEAYTLPILVYGIPPMAQFQKAFSVYMDVLGTSTAELIPGRKTPVLGVNHPYRFYFDAQSGPSTGQVIGSGRLGPYRQLAQLIMVQDLIAARWQLQMAADPSLDPSAVLEECVAYWQSPKRQAEVCAQVLHQGSLITEGPQGDRFRFGMSLQEAQAQCAAHGNDVCACKT
ncbi:MAG TPA: hypothetical protein VEZ71_09205 [Archangium sp.]|nr:hypothetical protein [Archangium sp.]